MIAYVWPDTSVWPVSSGDLASRELRYRGFQLGAGPTYVVTEAEGLRGYDTRRGDTPIPRGDGDTPGDHHLQAKHPILSVDALGPYDVVVPPLLEAFRPSRRREFPLVWVDGGEEVRLFCRVVEFPVVRRKPNRTSVSIGLEASDPRVYGAQHTIQLDPFTLSGGAIDDPKNDPVDASAEGGTDVTAHNGGGSDAHPQVTVSGPDSGSADGVEVTNTTNGSKVTIGASIGSGQTLTVRMREWVTHRLDTLIVELDGSNQYDEWTNRGEEFYLSPGNNTIRLDVLAGAEDGVRATLSWRDTWDGLRRDDD